MAEIDQTEVRGNGENVQCKRPSTQRKERTMAVQPKPLLSAASAALLALSLLGPPLLPGTSEVHGQDAMKGRPSVKYVFTVDYPVNGKDKYIAWVTSVAEVLKAPAEVRRITSYDDYYGASPHRVVEFEFDNFEDAGKYFANEKVSAVFADVPKYGLNGKVHVLVLRSDYTPK